MSTSTVQKVKAGIPVSPAQERPPQTELGPFSLGPNGLVQHFHFLYRMALPPVMAGILAVIAPDAAY